MSRSQITFTLGQGTITNPATGTDYISGMQFYGATTYLGSFATTPTQPVFSLSDAESKGITLDYADETKATATITWTPGGTAVVGDVITVTVTEKNPNGTTTLVTLCTYTLQAADLSDHTGDTLNTNITAAINALSYATATLGAGYTASYPGWTAVSPPAATTNVTTITARTGLGVNLNGSDPAVSVNNSHSITNTPSAFIGGNFSEKAIWNYHISEFFRMNPTSKLWVSFIAAPSVNFAEIQALQLAASGECMRIGVYSFVQRTAAQVVSDLNAMQTQANALFASYQPVAIFYAPNLGNLPVSALSNLQSVGNAQNCFCIVSQDGAAAGAQLFVNSGVTISNIGCLLGTSSAAAVSQDIGEIGAFNLTNGIEMNVPAFSNGQLVSSVASSLLDTLDTYRYGFCVNQTGYPGTFVNNDWTAIANTNAYNRLGRVLTINKVERQQYIALLPLLKSRIYLNADGTMTQTTIEQYIGAAEPRIMQMVNDGDLSPGNITGTALTKGVVNIDPTQNVNSQGYVAIVYNILGVDIADNINVTLQFTQMLA